MKNPRFWRDLTILLAVAGFAAIGISLAVDDAGEDSTLQIALMIAGVMVAPISAVAGIFLYASVRSFERLDRGEDVLGRWTITPDVWRSFAGVHRSLEERLQPEWRANAVEVPDTIDVPVEIVVTKEALRVGEAYFGAGKDGLQIARWTRTSPEVIELFYIFHSGQGSPKRAVLRFPVAPNASQEGRAVAAWYAEPVPMGPVARYISTPARAADRNPRKARNIALAVAAVSAAVGGFLIANADQPWVKTALNGDGVDALAVMIPAVAAPIVAVAALLLALIWHQRAKRS